MSVLLTLSLPSGLYSNVTFSVRPFLATLSEMATSIPQHFLVPFPPLFFSFSISLSYIKDCPSPLVNCKLQDSRDFCGFCPLLHCQNLEQCLAQELLAECTQESPCPKSFTRGVRSSQTAAASLRVRTLTDLLQPWALAL